MSMLITRLARNGLWLALALAYCVAPFAAYPPGSASIRDLAVLALAVLGSAVTVEMLDSRETRLSAFKQSIAVILAASFVLCLLSLPKDPFVPPAHIVLATLILFALLRTLALSAPRWRYPSFMSRNVLLLGNGHAAKTAKELIESSRGRYRLTAAIAHGEGEGEEERFGSLVDLARQTGARHLIVSFPERRGTMPATDIMRCRMQGVRVMDVPSFYEETTRKLYIESITPSWFIFSSGFCVSRMRRAARRLFDLAAAGIGLALALPFVPIVALCIKRDSPGPVFFRQVRIGLGGVPFMLFKLRTMRLDAENGTGAVWAGREDPRVTKIGRFLRKTRLDEVPQLINVICGEMSLIGPRPERPEFTRELERQIPFYSERHCMKPGVTGWAQVRYPYGSSVEDALEKLRYDLYYIKNQSFWLDMEIVFRTVLVVLLGRGAR